MSATERLNSPDTGFELCPQGQGLCTGLCIAITCGVTIKRADIGDVDIGKRESFDRLRAILRAGKHVQISENDLLDTGRSFRL